MAELIWFAAGFVSGGLYALYRYIRSFNAALRSWEDDG